MTGPGPMTREQLAEIRNAANSVVGKHWSTPVLLQLVAEVERLAAPSPAVPAAGGGSPEPIDTRGREHWRVDDLHLLAATSSIGSVAAIEITRLRAALADVRAEVDTWLNGSPESADDTRELSIAIEVMRRIRALAAPPAGERPQEGA